MLQVLTSHTPKLPKKVLKNTKNMTPNSCSVRPEKFYPYGNNTFQKGASLTKIWTVVRYYSHLLKTNFDQAFYFALKGIRLSLSEILFLRNWYFQCKIFWHSSCSLLAPKVLLPTTYHMITNSIHPSHPIPSHPSVTRPQIDPSRAPMTWDDLRWPKMIWLHSGYILTIFWLHSNFLLTIF